MTSQSNPLPSSIYYHFQNFCSSALDSSTSAVRSDLLRTIDKLLGLHDKDDRDNTNDANNDDGVESVILPNDAVVELACGGLGTKAGECACSQP